jgi:2-hydroxy-5-methyl-1-naphthoate 7-hydroxylase
VLSGIYRVPGIPVHAGWSTHIRRKAALMDSSPSSALPAIDPQPVDLHAQNRRLREAYGPVVLVELPGGGTAHWVLGHPEAEQVLRMDNGAVSADAREHWEAWRRGLIQPGHIAWSWVAEENMFSSDDPEHRRLGRVVQPAFSRARVEAMEAVITREVAGLLDGLAERSAGGGTVDVREGFAAPLPLAVLGELLGVPCGQRAAYEEAVSSLIESSRAAEAPAARERLTGLLRELLESRRARPGEDMASALVASDLSADEALAMCFMLVGAGFETTVSLIGSALVLLLSNREYLAAVRAGELGIGAVIEETLRLRPPLAARLVRAAARDFALDAGGEAYGIRAGEGIVISYAAAGRDPRVYRAPDEFDPRREPGAPLLSFGRGPHYCLGASLARLQARIAIAAFVDRFPGARLAEPDAVTWAPNLLTDGVAELSVRLG